MPTLSMPPPTSDLSSLESLAEFFISLADPARIKMLQLFLERQEMTMSDIVDATGFTQTKTSRHLALLRKYNMVVVREVHRYRYYRLRPDLVAKVKRCLE